MDCTCACWKHKELTIKCHKCDGKLSYTRIESINVDDEAKLKLQKLKRELQNKQADVAILKMDIRELENELNNIN